MNNCFRYYVLLVFSLFIWLNATVAQDTTSQQAQVAIKWAPTGLIAGNISLHGEYGFGKKSSLTAKLGVPVKVKQHREFEGDDRVLATRTLSFMAGYRNYLSGKQFKGLYLEPYFKYVHLNGDGSAKTTLGSRPVDMQINNNYDAGGLGLQLGAQFLVGKKMVIDFFFLGPEINWSRNKFKAVEISNTLPWTDSEAWEAERDVREFINDVPFLRNKTTIRVNREMRTVMADFKGSLPGYRIGVSFGIRL